MALNDLRVGIVLGLGGGGLLGDGAAEGDGVDCAIGHGGDGADFREGGVVEDEGLVFGGDAVEDAVGVGAGEEAALGIDGKGGDVRLAGSELDFALAGGGDAEDFALVAGAGEEGAIGGDGEGPDVAGLGIEVLGGLAVLDAVDAAIGGCAGVEPPSGAAAMAKTSGSVADQ